MTSDIVGWLTHELLSVPGARLISKSTLRSSNKQTVKQLAYIEISLKGVIPHGCLSASRQGGRKVCSPFRQSSCSQAFQLLHTWTEGLASLGHHFVQDLTLVILQLHQSDYRTCLNYYRICGSACSYFFLKKKKTL